MESQERVKAAEVQSRRFWLWRTSRQQNGLPKNPQTNLKKKPKTIKSPNQIKDGRQKTLNSNENFEIFPVSMQALPAAEEQRLKAAGANWNVTSMGTFYQEGLVLFHFCVLPGVKSHSNIAFLIQNLCWEEFGPRVCSASLFYSLCWQVAMCPEAFFSHLFFSPQLKNFFPLPLCEKSLCSPRWILCQESEENGLRVCEEKIFLFLLLH